MSRRRRGAGIVLAVLAAVLAVPAAAEPASPGGPKKPSDPFAPLAPLVGTWEGTSDGVPGAGTVRREYRFVLGGRFIEARNVSTYPPQEKNPKGEVHEDVGLLSWDRGRKVFVLRQFHVEGFVNTYAAPPPADAAAPVVFTSEAIENIPAGWRARETWRFPGPDELVEVFELAEPGKDFAVYSETRLRRVRGR